MNIIFTMYVLSDSGLGGITTSLINLSKLLVEKGHKVTVLELSGNINFKNMFFAGI